MSDLLLILGNDGPWNNEVDELVILPQFTRFAWTGVERLVDFTRMPRID